MTNLMDDVNQLLRLGVGEMGRLNHIKESLEKNKMLYSSDRQYLQKLTERYLGKKTENIHGYSYRENSKKLSDNDQQNSNNLNEFGYNGIEYDKQGFDRYGFDRNGWNGKGKNRETGTKYDREGFDRYGLNRKKKIILTLAVTFFGLGIVTFVAIFVLGISEIAFPLLYIWASYGIILFVVVYAWAVRSNIRDVVRD